MSITTRFSYRRLKHEPIYEEDSNSTDQINHSAVEAALEAARAVLKARTWSRLRRVPVRRRFRVRAFGVRIRRYLRSRKVRLLRRVKSSLDKVVQRVKDSQAHFGDLFAGNYLFLQVNPAPLKRCVDQNQKSFKVGYDGSEKGRNPRYYLPSINNY